MDRSILLLLALTLVVFLLLTTDLGTNDLIGGDEGYYGIMARNISQDLTYLANPSLSPLGTPGDKPYLFAALLAAAIRIGGTEAVPMRLLTLILSVPAGLFLFFLARTLGLPGAGIWGAVLYLCTPLFAHFGRTVAAEMPLTTVSLLGAWLFLIGVRKNRLALTLLSGMIFGLGFLMKLWLVLPPLVAVILGSRLVGNGDLRVRPDRFSTWGRMLGVFMAGAVIVGSSQLLLCAVLTPENIGHWVRVYFSFSLADRVAGSEFATYWHKPWYFYILSMGRAASIWLPLASLGFVGLVRSSLRSSQHRLPLIITLLWLAFLLPMSLLSVKSFQYMIPLFPALSWVAGFGICRLKAHSQESDGSSREMFWAASLATVLCLATQLHSVDRFPDVKLNSPVALLLQLGWILIFLWHGVVRRRLRKLSTAALAGMIALSVLGGLGRDIQIVRAEGHVTGYSHLARLLEPALGDLDPAQPCFIAPEWPSMSFYTFRSGRYWRSPYVPDDPGFTLKSLRGRDPYFFVVATGYEGLYGGLPDSETKSVIESEGHLLPQDFYGPNPDLRVYVNDALWQRILLPGTRHSLIPSGE